jgi:hypothetical protein
MQIAPQHGVEALDERHGAALRLALGAEFSGAPNERSKDRICENTEDIGQETCIIGQAVAEIVWERKHPLPDRNSRENTVDQMRSSIGHPSPAAGIAETAFLA